MSSSSNLQMRTSVRPLRQESDRLQRPALAAAVFDEQLFSRSEAESEAQLAPTWGEGYESGIEEGMALGRALTAAEEAAQDRRVDDLCRAIQLAADRVVAEQQRLATQARDALLAAAFQLAETIIGREIAEQPRSAQDALRTALSLAPEHVSCTARLNPDDLSALQQRADPVTGHRDVTLVADHTVAMGDCVIDLPAGQIALRLHEAIDRARQVVLGGGSDDDTADTKGATP